ncbi:unnamed protein product [Paramecium sonneborni]|uniref:ZZ-type domain-containing protein n=1 Tax=Paramecium sonneborni TaxID=65129 RepID=A0A8S1L3B8_9CILI|nr:unnamed protein product [Paramecium sonneborni]
MKLFEGQEQPKLKLKINKKFAEKYQQKKERELLDKKGEILDQEESSEDQIPEDENGDLINDKVTQKFIETLAKIRYKHPDIYKNKEIFQEEDFDEPEQFNQNQKKITYADLQGQGIEDEQEEIEEEYEPKIGMTPNEEQIKLKNAFIDAAKKSSKQQKELLKVKQKTAREIEDENKEFEKLLKKQQPEEQDILQRYWGNEQDLDEKDKFLRKYILTKGWIDKDDMNEIIDSSEDEERMDEFEEKYNFRFEEEGGNQLITYERDLKDTLRLEPETARQRQRQAKAQREKEQKEQLERELKQLKTAKKNEIISKLQKIQQIGGIKDAKLLLEEIDKKDFQPEEFDKKMEKIFDEEYFENEEDSPEELEQNEEEQEQDEQGDKKEQNLDVDNVIKIKPTIPIIMKKNLNQEEMDALQDEDVTIWWFCDVCKQTIQPNNFRWDCQVCEDYTLCENCIQQHSQHKLKKALVPKSCKPPKTEDAQSLINQFKYCRACQIKMTEENDYYQSKKDYLCVDCFEKDKNQQRYTLVEAQIVDINKLLDENPEQLKEKLPSNLKNIIDEYYSLDFEDVIAGGIKTKFQYIDVDKQDFGLTNDDLLYADDKLLNQYVSIKKLAPYRDGQIKIKKNKAEKLLAQIRKSTKRNKKLILKGIDPKDFQKKQQEEEQQEKKQKVQLEVEDVVENTTLQVNSKRLKTYGV